MAERRDSPPKVRPLPPLPSPALSPPPIWLSALTSPSPLPDAPLALQAVKSLGKNPAGSEVIATSANLSALLSLYHTYKDVPEASNEALRCVANALLLVDQARATLIDKQVGGGDFAVELLEVSPPLECA